MPGRGRAHRTGNSAATCIVEVRRRSVPPWGVLKTKAERMEFVRATGQGALHPSGACKMGTDSMSVVDPQLRVRGIDGLRVADSSILPRVPSGNLNAPCIMVGERASDFIKGNKMPMEFRMAGE